MKSSVLGGFAVVVAMMFAACGGCKGDNNRNEPVQCGDVECSSAATCVEDVCVCKPGFEGDGQTCTEIRLACEDDAACGAAGTCADGFCSCDDGYTVTTTGCADTDECTAGLDDCDPAATCTNTDGGFTCACPGSAPGDGKSCEPFDECAAGADDCEGEHIVCADLDAGFECVCETGYTKARDNCSLLVDCNADPTACDENATCTDTEAGAACVCDEGFAGDGASCRQTGFTKLSAQDGHVCGLRPNGIIACWGTRRLDAVPGEERYGMSRPTAELSGNTWTSLDVSTFDVCATRDDGTIWCAAQNATWRQIGTDSDWVDIRTANLSQDDHHCALKSNGTLWCWGTNSHGQLGLGTTEDVATPTQVGTATWSSLAVHHARTCGIQTDGTLWCWGGEGILGPEIWSNAPRQVGADSDWALVEMSGFGAYAMKSDGNVVAWRTHVPEPESQGPEAWASFGRADTADCGVKLDGTLWCKGANVYGIVGVEGVSVTESFVQVGTATDWESVFMNNDFACAIRTNSDTYCWGRNEWGQIGVGKLPVQLEPAIIAPGTSHTAMAISPNYSCAIRNGGALACTGHNLIGALGLPSMEVFALRTHQVVHPGPWDQVAVGGQHTCVIGGGALQCFGASSVGQTGHGPGALPSHEPMPVGDATDWVDIAAANNFTCGRRSDESLYCWGFNGRGQLGHGDTDTRDVPTRVGNDTWSRIFMGLSSHVCGTRAPDDSLWCWGSNDSGELGTGDMAPSLVPVQVGADAWLSVSIGYQTTIGVKADGTLWGWGALAALNGESEPVLVPTRIGSDANWTAVAASNQHACALRDDGGLFCWGQTYGGATGQPNPTEFVISEPTRVGTSANWSQIYADQFASCGLQTGGALLCWGRDHLGSLGFGAAWYPTPQRVRD